MARKLPLRRCVGCNEMKDKRDMMRVVKTKESEFFLDETGKANGRGAYICKSVACFEKAVKNKGLERSFKAKIPDETYETLKEKMGQFE